jgi:endonuclease/exonuclease/phosphatase family metal-dependent hydrolase
MALTSCSSEGESVVRAIPTDDSRDTFRVMTFNMWHGGDAGGQSLAKTLEVIRRADARIVGAQETHGYGEPRPDNSIQLADELGWEHIDQGHFNAVMTDYAIEDTVANGAAIKVEIGENKYVWLVNTHLNYIPYQPYQLNNKEYGDYPFITTEQEAIYWANEARKNEVDTLLQLISLLGDEWPVIVTGDFNEPSHLDWTAAAANAGIHKIEVAWPSTRALAETGMKDAYREYRPDEVAHPGNTWTPLKSDGEVHDRIDFVFYRGKQLQLVKTEIVGEAASEADIVVGDYPSDHRAVVATFVWVE